jgi:hypothetical protein
LGVNNHQGTFFLKGEVVPEHRMKVGEIHTPEEKQKKKKKKTEE